MKKKTAGGLSGSLIHPIRISAGVLSGIIVGTFAGIFPVQAGEWDRSEDGRYWMYYDYSEEPLKDEWIEYEGKTYYLDSNGYMKTGWTNNKNDGNRYYLGPDGDMWINSFTPDDKYVGPDGVEVEKYDTYRRAVKTELKTIGNKRNSSKSSNRSQNSTDSASQPQIEACFLLTDLNQDGYKDLVVMEADVNALSQADTGTGNLLEIAVWDAEEEKFLLAAEFDDPKEGDSAALYADPRGGGVWLERSERGGELYIFQMEYNTSQFNNVWNFTIEKDDWEDGAYFVNGEEEDRYTWDAYIAQARRDRGNMPLTGYLPITDENIQAQVDHILAEDELNMW